MTNRCFNDIHCRWFWICSALIIKFILFVIFLEGTGIAKGEFIGRMAGDSSSYITPIENLIKHGSYSPDYRMPGYGFIYYLFRLFFDQSLSLNLLLISQLLLDAISVYFLALIAYAVFQSKFCFYFTFTTYAISSYVSIFNLHVLTESFGASAIILFIYFLIRFLETGKKNYLIQSSIFYTWLVFLKPVYIPLILVVFVFMYSKEKKMKTLLRASIIFLIPFMLVEASWVIRNYNVNGKINLLYNGYLYPGFEDSYQFHTMKFVQAFGGNYVWWDPSAEIRWFGIQYAENEKLASLKKVEEIKLPSYIYTKDYNEDSLKVIVGLIESLNDKKEIADSEKIITLINSKLDRYRHSFIAEKPMHYYLLAPLMMLKKYLFHSGTYNLFSHPSHQLGTTKFIIKIFYSLFYLIVVSLGLFSCISLIKNIFRLNLIAFILVIIGYNVVVFPLLLRFCEMRYFVTVFPLVIIFVGAFVERLSIKIKN